MVDFFAPNPNTTQWDVVRLLWRLVTRLREGAMEDLNAIGLSGPMDAYLLDTIGQKHYPTEACKVLSLSAPTVSHMLKRLEKQGHVLRHADPTDLRKFRFELTASGQHAIEQSRIIMMRSIEGPLSTLEPEQIATLTHLLQTMTEKP